MAEIISYRGADLLTPSAVEAIKREAFSILSLKDVAKAWKSSAHLKKEISSLPEESVKPFLEDYRRISAKLKTLAFPLLGFSEITNLLTKNISLLEDEDLIRLGQGISAWLAVSDKNEASKFKKEFLPNLPNLCKQNILVYENNDSEKSTIFHETGESQDKNSEDLEFKEISDHSALSKKIGEAKKIPFDLDLTAKKISLMVVGSENKEDVLRRIKALIESRLRDIRTKIQISEYLRRPFMVGGLGLKEESIEEVLSLIEKEYEKFHSSVKKQKPVEEFLNKKQEKNQESSQSAFQSQDTKKENNKPQIKPIPIPESSKEEKKLDPSGLIKTSQEEILKKENKAIPKTSDLKNPTPGLEAEKPQVKHAFMRQMRPQAQLGQTKKRLEDIKSDSFERGRTVSRVGEVSSITLSDFRSYGSSEQAADRIFYTIESISENSFQDKVSAVKAFRSSPLFKNYVSLAQAGFSQGKKLSEILLDPVANPEKITEEELFAISSLNRRLK